MARESRETDEVLVCMAQRLQSQLERQLTLVERLQVHGRDESLADLAELRTSLQRSLRGSENVLVLAGAQQGPRSRGPRSVADVLADARSGVEDVSRIGLGPAPDASIAPRAVAGLIALFTELLTHAVTAAAPLSRVDVASNRSEDGGVVVEVVVDGPSPSPGEIDELTRRLGDRPIIDDIVSNRVGLFVAARLARRSGVGLRVQQRRGTLAGPGIVVVVHCPPDLLDAVAFAAPDAPRSWNRDPATRNGNGHAGRSNGNGNGRPGHPGNGHPANGHPGNGASDPRPAVDARGTVGERNGYDDGFGEPPVAPERSRRPDPLSDPLPGFGSRRDPDPVRPDPVRPDPMRSNPMRSDPMPTDTRRPDAAQTGPGQTGPGLSGPGSAGPVQRDAVRLDADRRDPVRQDRSRTERTGAAEPLPDAHRPGTPPTEPPRGEPPRVELSPGGFARPETSRPETSRFETSRPVGPRNGTDPGLPRRGQATRATERRPEPLWRDEPRRPEDPFRPGGAVRPLEPPVLPAGPVWTDEPPLSRGSGDAELFGPLTGSLRDRMRESAPTPIYEAVASAWFVDDDGAATAGRAAGGPPPDWNTPSDAEWRAASERAARPAGPPPQSTSAGLPRRRPGTQMVAPPLHGDPAPQGGSRDREPEKVRERLAVYQQGLERGRHRAADTDR